MKCSCCRTCYYQYAQLHAVVVPDEKWSYKIYSNILEGFWCLHSVHWQRSSDCRCFLRSVSLAPVARIQNLSCNLSGSRNPKPVSQAQQYVSGCRRLSVTVTINEVNQLSEGSITGCFTSSPTSRCVRRPWTLNKPFSSIYGCKCTIEDSFSSWHFVKLFSSSE